MPKRMKTARFSHFCEQSWFWHTTCFVFLSPGTAVGGCPRPTRFPSRSREVFRDGRCGRHDLRGSASDSQITAFFGTFPPGFGVHACEQAGFGHRLRSADRNGWFQAFSAALVTRSTGARTTRLSSLFFTVFQSFSVSFTPSLPLCSAHASLSAAFCGQGLRRRLPRPSHQNGEAITEVVSTNLVRAKNPVKSWKTHGGRSPGIAGSVSPSRRVLLPSLSRHIRSLVVVRFLASNHQPLCSTGSAVRAGSNLI
jgi:hypothetical protein